MTAAAPKRRRVRLTRTHKNTGLHAQSGELKDLIEVAHKQYAVAERAGIKAAAALEKIQEIMKTNGQDKVVTDHAVAEMLVPRSNSSTLINPRQFREAVTNDDEFYDSVSVGVTAARKVLPEKTIDKISKKTAAKKKDPIAKVRARTGKD